VGILLLLLVLPPSGAAWEDAAQRLVISNAVLILPPPLRTYFEDQRNTLVQLATDPSQWGMEPFRPQNGYVRLDEYGRYPFVELPRDYNAAVRKFGRTKLTRNGTLPWHIGTYALKLEEAFRAQQWDQVKLCAAILARYVAEQERTDRLRTRAAPVTSADG